MSNRSRRSLLTGFRQDNVAVRPPWSLTESQFIEHCTRCGDCISVCESNVIISGKGGFPELDFNRAECTFCRRCVLVCKAPVFNQEGRDEKSVVAPWHHKVNISSECLTFRHVTCRSCQDSCDRLAILFKLKANAVASPLLQHELCSGCGACISSCPVNAITICHNKLTEET